MSLTISSTPIPENLPMLLAAQGEATLSCPTEESISIHSANYSYNESRPTSLYTTKISVSVFACIEQGVTLQRNTTRLWVFPSFSIINEKLYLTSVLMLFLFFLERDVDLQSY